MHEETLSEDEFIEDVLIRAFIMMLGVNIPPENVRSYMESWVKLQAKQQNKPITEEFVLQQIPAYITHLHNRR